MKMLRSLSVWSVIAVTIAAFTVRFCYFTNNPKNGYNATTWDALGYYMYLPATFIYGDVTELKWFPAADKKYGMSGGELYQATKLGNGNYTFKYLGGVAIMQAPFFAVGHIAALITGAPADGFSRPYQYAILFGAIFWFIIGCIFLRKVLLRYYSEQAAALTIVLLGLASNLLQYVSVDGAMSHVYIFPLYAIVLWLTIRWHEQPKAWRAVLIGLVCGLATISRPTELIMLFIPLLWGTDGNGSLGSKWQLVRRNRGHVLFAMAGGVIGILPQLLYWKYTTGSFVYDVGSKWYFLNPWLRVLFGLEKGWFVYTPVALFMVAGLFLLKGKPFRKAVIVFCLLNLWIIMAWSDWRYGASYSARALTQSYPVFALALAAFIERAFTGRKKSIVLVVGAYLIFVNLFQIGQYNSTVLHFDDMNAAYYRAIYLDPDPTPLDYSLLDTADIMSKKELFAGSERIYIEAVAPEPGKPAHLLTLTQKLQKLYYRISLMADEGYKTGWITVRAFDSGLVEKERKFRLAVPKSKPGRLTYEAFLEFSPQADSVQLFLETFDRLGAKEIRIFTKW
jgi:hypothetical protein